MNEERAKKVDKLVGWLLYGIIGSIIVWNFGMFYLL